MNTGPLLTTDPFNAALKVVLDRVDLEKAIGNKFMVIHNTKCNDFKAFSSYLNEQIAESMILQNIQSVLNGKWPDEKFERDTATISVDRHIDGVTATGGFTTTFKGVRHEICIYAYTDTEQGGRYPTQYKAEISARQISRSACCCF